MVNEKGQPRGKQASLHNTFNDFKKKTRMTDERNSKASQKSRKRSEVDEEGEPMNPALNEPNAKAIVNQGEAEAAPSVSASRKAELLVQARADRRKWIQIVPLPYASQRDRNNVWSVEDRLNNLQSSLACKRLPVATQVLSELYGLESKIRTTDEIAERVDGIVSFFCYFAW